MDSSKTALKVRAQLDGFLGIFSARFSKPMRRFLSQMLFGIQAAQDVKLSRIGRALQESIPLGKTENRLSRNLAHGRMDEALHECVLEHVAPTIGRDTLVVIDPSDIQKDYARKMPCLAKVWDGSKGDVGGCASSCGWSAAGTWSGARRRSCARSLRASAGCGTARMSHSSRTARSIPSRSGSARWTCAFRKAPARRCGWSWSGGSERRR